MCLIYIFGALAITSGVFSQEDATAALPEVRGKLYLFRNTRVLSPADTSVLDLSKPVSFPPSIEVFVAVGSSVRIPCADGEGKGVEWRFNSSVLVLSPVLSIHNTSLKDRGSYTCHQPNGNLIQTVSLNVGCRVMLI